MKKQHFLRASLLVFSALTIVGCSGGSSSQRLSGRDRTQYDCASIVHCIEKNWGLGSLGRRDAVPMSGVRCSVFDYDRKPITAAFRFVMQTSSNTRSVQSVRSPLQNDGGHSYNLDYYNNLVFTRPVANDKQRALVAPSPRSPGRLAGRFFSDVGWRGWACGAGGACELFAKAGCREQKVTE